jgi:hypothetical protein
LDKIKSYLTLDLEQVNKKVILSHMNTRYMKELGGWDKLLGGNKCKVASFIWDSFKYQAYKYGLYGAIDFDIKNSTFFDRHSFQYVPSVIISMLIKSKSTYYGEHHSIYEVRVFRCDEVESPFIVMTYSDDTQSINHRLFEF